MRRARSTAESIAASRALVAMVQALTSNGPNTMMFTADADETLDAENVSNQFDEFSDEDDAMRRQQTMRRARGTCRHRHRPKRKHRRVAGRLHRLRWTKAGVR